MKLQKNILLFHIVSTIVFMLAVFSVVGYSVVRSQMEEIKSDAQSVADLIASRLDGDEALNYAITEQTDDRYFEIKASLREVKENFPEVAYMYVFTPVEDNKVKYIYDIYTQADVEKNHDKEWDLGVTEEWDLTKGNIGLLLESGIIGDKFEIESSEYGYTTSRYAPCYGSDGKLAAVVGIDFDLKKISVILSKSIGILFTIILGFSVLLMVSVFYMTRKRVVEPIKEIEEKTAAFAESSHDVNTVSQYFCKVEDDSENEIDILGKNINTMMQEIDSYISENGKMTAEKERIGMELEMASKIQNAVLSKVFPEHATFKLYASMDPAKEVGGDFYDFFMLDDDHLALVIADVSGKGIAAALYMMVSKIYIENTLKNLKSPALTLESANEKLCANNAADMFVTVWLGVLDLKTGVITASNAGHEYPVIKEAGKDYKLIKDTHGFVIGGIPGMKYTDYEIKLNPGDELFVYTDGVPEATNADKELFGTANMLTALNEKACGEPKENISTVKASIDAFVKDATQFDDITMLNLVYMGDN